MKECQCSVLLYDSEFAETAKRISQKRRVDILQIGDLEELIGDLESVERYPYEGSWGSLSSLPIVVSHRLGFFPCTSSLLTSEKILHTSGSTGMPRSVPFTHSALGAIDAQRLVSQNDPEAIQTQLEIMSKSKVVYIAFPLFHVAGFALSCYLLMSGSVLLFGYPRQPPNISTLRDALRVKFLEAALIPPSMIDDIARDSKVLEDISQLRCIFSGGGIKP
jgi:acyl-CoA synthetase (AMP-forming)/AMP-acid ligase II